MSIDKIKAGDDLSQSINLVHENIKKLISLFPEIVVDGKIDFRVLRQLLGEVIEEDDEGYRFTWIGKSQSKKEANKQSTGTLRPVKDESIDWNTTNNLFIEGDNLEVLKLLQKNYGGGAKLIYIDPPYNTGKDFVYKDNYTDNLQNYQEITGQFDSKGNRLSTNSDSDGRYHSNWLSMMYPRLILARRLLSDDGVIFISVDDNEVERLTLICTEIFGEHCFVNNFVWICNSKGRQIKGSGAATTKEYILCYCKNSNSISKFLIDVEHAKHSMSDIYKGFNYQVKTDSLGDYITTNELYNSNSKFNENTRPNLVYDIYYNPMDGQVVTRDLGDEAPKGFVRIPPHQISKGENKYHAWRWEKDKVVRDKDDLEFVKSEGKWKVYTKRRDFNSTSFKDLITNISTSLGIASLKKLDLNFFDHPKPIQLIKLLIGIIGDRSMIILDFFSGSATTAHAVLEMNYEDNGTRRFIQIQLPEATSERSDAYRAGYENIAEIGKERIRRVIKKIKQEDPSKAETMDLGFKVFKLDSSNIKTWDGSPDKIEQSLLDSIESIKEDRSQEDVLYEILLKYGLDLTLPIEERILGSQKIFNVGSGRLFVCLDDEINCSIAEAIGRWKEESSPENCRVVFKDSGFSDVQKVNSFQILRRYGVTDVMSV